jgi:hypothetical protein
MCMEGRRLRAGFFALSCLLICGCVGWTGFDMATVSSFLDGGGTLGGFTGGNVVISYTNRTSRSAAWSVTWTGPESPEPMLVTTRTGPNETSNTGVEGAVSRIALGGTGPQTAAVVLNGDAAGSKVVRYQGKPLVCGVDFQPGDIISFTLMESASGDCTITTEVVSGG